jgi:hypothetical protein
LEVDPGEDLAVGFHMESETSGRIEIVNDFAGESASR